MTGVRRAEEQVMWFMDLTWSTAQPAKEPAKRSRVKSSATFAMNKKSVKSGNYSAMRAVKRQTR